MSNIYEPVEKVLISEKEIEECIERLGKEISEDYKGKNPLLVSVLSGSFIFTADLMRTLQVPAEITFMFASSYGNSTVSSGKVDIHAAKGFQPEGRDIIIVEDIIDSGRTLKKLKEYLEECGAKSVEICTFLDKPSRRVIDVDVKYTGFEIPDEFVIGYGLDFDYKYRQFPYVGVLKKEYYE